MTRAFRTLGGPCEGTPVAIADEGDPPKTLLLKNWQDREDDGTYQYDFHEEDSTYRYVSSVDTKTSENLQEEGPKVVIIDPLLDEK